MMQEKDGNKQLNVTIKLLLCSLIVHDRVKSDINQVTPQNITVNSPNPLLILTSTAVFPSKSCHFLGSDVTEGVSVKGIC